jgi:hypothetical protein
VALALAPLAGRVPSQSHPDPTAADEAPPKDLVQAQTIRQRFSSDIYEERAMELAIHSRPDPPAADDLVARIRCGLLLDLRGTVRYKHPIELLCDRKDVQ